MAASGHRLVHGGERLRRPTVVDATIEAELRAAADLAPRHNPPALAAMGSLHRLRPQLPIVACVDTAFHATLPAEARTYPLPAAWSDRWSLPRYGFHGLSHAWVARRAPELLDHAGGRLRLVSCHLGAGASLAAIDGGRSVDTTMGFTPLEGIVMATRSGSIDPGLLLWVQRQGGISPQQAEHALNHESGLLGLSRRSGDMRTVLAGVEAGDDGCRLAFGVYVHRLRAGIAAMTAAMGGLDAIVFTGGVGERSAQVRAAAAARLGFLGVDLDGELNSAAVGPDDGRISPSGARVPALVIRAREDLEIAREVRACLRESAR